MFPKFHLMGSDDTMHDLSSAAQTKKALLYFYPADNTPGCSKQAQDFSRLLKDYKEKDITVIGISHNSLESHKKFISDKDLKILLLVDTDNLLAKELKVFGEKTNYGKKYMGIIRSTFLVEVATGKILQEWRNVKATGHGERILKLV